MKPGGKGRRRRRRKGRRFRVPRFVPLAGEVLAVLRAPRSAATVMVKITALGSIAIESMTKQHGHRVLVPAHALPGVIGALCLAQHRVHAGEERRCREAVVRLLRRYGSLPAWRVRQWTTAHHDRALVDRVLGQLVEAGDIVLTYEPGRRRMHRALVAVYGLAEGSHLATSPGSEARP